MNKILFLHFGQGLLFSPNTFIACHVEMPAQWVAGAVPNQTLDVIDCDFKTDEQIIESVVKHSPQVVGVSALTAGFPRALRLAKVLKLQLPDSFFVFGGWHSSLVPQDVLKEEPIDTVVIGRGENVIADIVFRPDDFSGKVINTRERPFVSVIPWRNKEIVDSLHSSTLCSVPNFASILITPGCSFRCIYCATPTVYGRRFYFRPIDQVLDEVKMLIEKYGVGTIFIRDENPFLQRKRLEEFCHVIVAQGLNKRVRFRSYGYVSLVDEHLLDLLKEAGWREIVYGVETIDPKQLKQIGRSRTSAEKMLRAFELTRSRGIFATAGFMVMYPGDTLDSLERFGETLEYLRPDRFFVSFYTPQPGTPSWQECQPFLRPGLGWEYFNGSFPVLVSLDGSSPEQIIKTKNQVVKNYYQSDTYHALMKKWSIRLGDDFQPLTQRHRDRIQQDFGVDIWK